MEQRILIKNLTQAKAGQTENFSADTQKELTVGRDPGCDVKFNPNDDLVSRRHAKITRVNDTPEYTIADLGSRNGTMVNGRRIFESVKLHCGDQVQLGPDGPKFEFDLDPRPASMIKPTRLAETTATPNVTLTATRESGALATAAARAPSANVGKATVERMIGETKAQGRKQTIYVAAALLIVVAAVAGWLYASRPKIDEKRIADSISSKMAPNGLNPTQIAQRNTESTVLIEMGWKLIDTESGKQLYQSVIPNRAARPKNAPKDQPDQPLIQGAGSFLPVFAIYNNKLEPLLTTDDGGGNNEPIGGRGSGTGFLVSSDGFILTNRHVAASWFTRYDFEDAAGIVIKPADNEKGVQLVPIGKQSFPQWVPAHAQFISSASLNFSTLRKVPEFETRGKDLDGRHDYLDVTFAKNRVRIPAKLARTSDQQDVAMLKIEIPQSLRKVELNDNYDTIKVGDPVVTLGYPGVSAQVVGVVRSKDPFNPSGSAKEIPDPTLSSGNVGRILRGSEGLEASQQFAADYYQLTINSTGPGNSGGPVFDDQGRVVAIFTMGWFGQVHISGAVPIRYGMELMGVQPVKSK